MRQTGTSRSGRKRQPFLVRCVPSERLIRVEQFACELGVTFPANSDFSGHIILLTEPLSNLVNTISRVVDTCPGTPPRTIFVGRLLSHVSGNAAHEASAPQEAHRITTCAICSCGVRSFICSRITAVSCSRREALVPTSLPPME